MRAFTAAHATSVTSHCDQVAHFFEDAFSALTTAFPEWATMVGRLHRAKRLVLEEGWAAWPAVDEAHNELCVAAAILGSPIYPIRRLEYEPCAQVGARTIDFRVSAADGRTWLIDVKTIAPQFIDRWEQFENARSKGWLTEGAELVFVREGLGGLLWHQKVASRSRMLEYTLELEEKLLGYGTFDPLTTVMMFCSNGAWQEDELEDFVAFYVDGRHRADDTLASMEDHAVKAKGISLPRRIRRFGYLERCSEKIEVSVVNWNVRPPSWPPMFGAEVSV